ncbi:unnamed protein product, partial [Rotaria magnacalcarata]
GRIHQELAHCSGGDQVEYDKALKDYEAALRIRLKSLPIDHSDVAVSYYNLASLHLDRQEYEEANNQIQKALNVQRKLFSAHHPDIRQTINLEKKIKIMLDYRTNQSNQGENTA